MKSNLISVIVPVFNNEQTISETINSVINQTNPNWELICVDDGSEDNSVSIIKEYCKKDNRISLIIRDTEPKGGSHCRNIGAFNANGEYVMFLDADDLLSEICLQNRLKAIENTNYDFVVFPMARFSNTIEKSVMYSNLTINNFKYYFATSFAAWQVTSPLFRMDFFRSLQGFDFSFLRLQDVELHLRAVLRSNSYKVSKDARPDCFYRFSKSTKKINVKKFEKCQMAYKQYIDLIMKNIDKFDNQQDLSKSMLCLLACIIFTINIVKVKKGNYQNPDFINTAKIDKFLIRKDRLIYNILKNTPTCWIKIILSYLIRKLTLKTIK